VNANTVSAEHIAPLAEHIRENAARVMGADRAAQLADALASCDARSAPVKGGHKLAVDAAARLLATGKLRQAEKAYQELVAKYGDRNSILGLAQTQAALEDVPAALETLRAAASKFAKAGDRGEAVSLLAAAVAFGPGDLSSHRRLAAALANQGDLTGAVDEYQRYVDECLANGDPNRALLELSYGRETLGELPGLIALVDRISHPGRESAPRADAPRPPARKSLIPRSENAPTLRVSPLAQPAAAKSATQSAAPKSAAPKPAAAKPAAPKMPEPTVDWGQPANAAPKTQETPAVRTRPDASPTAFVLKGAQTVTHAQNGDLDSPVDVLARAGMLKRMEKPLPALDIEPLVRALTPVGSGLDAAAMAASRAALLTSARDARATDASLDAARRLLALGKIQSASDVLLDFIGHGFTDREAQRLLIEIDCGIGRRDMAREKCNLLSHAYRLDGKADVAEDVERLGRIL
jgi:tetratricopeptide (TPR) repeat protein